MTTTTEAGWQLRGTAADAYEQFLVPAIFTDLARELADAADVQAGETALDVGCGTGIVARTVARRVGPTGAVTGIDLNPTMLATARRVTAGTRPPITFHEADLHAMPVDDGSQDVVLCQQVLQFVPDRVAALAEMRRVARPSTGRVAVGVLGSLERHPVYAALVEALGRHAGPEAATMMASPFTLEDGERLRADAEAAGLRDVRLTLSIAVERFPSVPDMVRREAAASPLAGPLSALDTDEWEALVDELEVELAPWRDDDGLTFPNVTHLVVGRA